jgi:hypothetical protein
MSNMRVLKGSGYTSVTVPTAPLTAVTNTQLLTCQSNRFVDNSTNNFTITRNGDVSVQAFSPFAPTAAYSAATNGGSGYFDGTGDYLSSTISALAGAFSIEFWFYRPASGNNFCFTIGDSNTGGNTSAEVYIGTSGTVLNYWANNAAQITGTPAPTGQWVYLAVTRDASNVVRLYQNGTQVGGTYTQSGTLSTALRIGTEWYNGASTGTTNGYIGNFRVSNNVRTVTTIPTSPFSNDGNTVFLANFTNAGITDATAKNVLETVGNAQISTTQSKFGGSSMYFDGTGDYVLTAPRASNILGNGDFTVEFWAYPSNTSSAFRALVSSENYAGVAGGWSIYQNGTSLEIWLTSGQIINATSALTSSTWQHVALSRASGTVRLFVNGTSVGSVSNSVEWTGQQIYVGDNNYSGIDYFYIGYIDDLRITKGYARYTSSFTPPTAAFPLS